MNVERRRRSLLPVPASDVRKAAAATSEVDGVMLDLEDTVTRGAKPLAPDNAVAALSRRDFGQKELVVRINALATAQGRRDLGVIGAARPHAVCLPKIGAVGDLLRADRAVPSTERSEQLYAMTKPLLAARAAVLDALDGHVVDPARVRVARRVVRRAELAGATRVGSRA
jgi:citrate lyase subunit beta / citryl-CoA lyase